MQDLLRTLCEGACQSESAWGCRQGPSVQPEAGLLLYAIQVPAGSEHTESLCRCCCKLCIETLSDEHSNRCRNAPVEEITHSVWSLRWLRVGLCAHQAT